MSPSGRNVTQLLVARREGDKGAMDQLMPLVYGHLQALARHHLSGERPGYTHTPSRTCSAPPPETG
jgi:hypothetical protein